VLLARALVRNPELLLLDEPTNHLDIEAIGWLEGFLAGYDGALLFVTHDRVFLETLATRILDLDRGRLNSWPGDYAAYRERKEAWLEQEARRAAAFDKRLAEEEVWIRQGVRERRTRNEGRVRRLIEMRRERRERRERLGKARLAAEEAERSGRLVIKADGLSFAYGDRTILRDFSAEIMRGDRVGIVGPNGSGKTTLLRLLLGELPPDGGTVRHGTRLEIAYFDQLHAQLDETRSVLENVADGNDTITRGGRRMHVLGYLKQFLFTSERARGGVASLSGGERNRLLLARLFARPSNVLVLDEPTNDLDLETLELLEELLLDYPGTVLLVSHDRALLNRVVTSSFVLEGEGRVREYLGGYDDWIRERSPAADDRPRTARRVEPPAGAGRAEERPRRLTYREKQELEALPARIEELEARIAALHTLMADPDTYRRPPAEIAAAHAELRALEAEHEAAFRRWEELEALA
jgi:ATP-binding cassette subfamily F protein uup